MADVTGELTAGGRTRGFALRLPRGASGGMPLVIVLHGNHPDATGQMMRDWTTFDAQADAFGFAVAYPDGVGGCWADGRGVTTADEAGVDDVAFLRALVDTSAERHGTHPDRAVVAGVPPGPGDMRTTEFSTQTTAEGGVGGTRVTAWTVFGGGHTWPGARPFPGTAETGSAEFDAAEEICRFAGPLLAAADSRRL
jgi:poly(3-hydroxybutyrate) depolymerase